MANLMLHIFYVFGEFGLYGNSLLLSTDIIRYFNVIDLFSLPVFS